MGEHRFGALGSKGFLFAAALLLHGCGGVSSKEDAGVDAGTQMHADAPADTPADSVGATEAGGEAGPPDTGGGERGTVAEGAMNPAECYDGIDNDGDGMRDCADLDCGGRACRASAGACDAEEVCTGGVCPADGNLPATQVCRPAAGDCDQPEMCTGTSPACPSDGFKAAGTTCRTASGGCDVAETCSGADAQCPANGYQTMGMVCRPSAGACDVEEKCDGMGQECPEDVFRGSETVCRPAARGSCDLAERCDGTAATCPADGVQLAGTICRAANGACDMAEACNGTSAACPTDAFAQGTVCRPADGVCDKPETCDGTSRDCPTDAFLTSGVCRQPSSTSGCDNVAESCDGSGPDCPADMSSCVGATYCNGTSCVAKKGPGEACGGAGECNSGFCADGVCCNVSCTSPCRSCNMTASRGTCTSYALGANPDNTSCGNYNCNASGQCAVTCSGATDPRCHAGNYCDVDTCAPKKANGVTCDVAAECTSGNCTDGYCCNTACTGVCQACNKAGFLGTCRNHDENTDPENGCPGYRCNASGACKTSCTASGNACTSQVCDTDRFCDGSACAVKKVNSAAATCTSDCECKSGFCVDGHCCNTRCDGPCQSCGTGTCNFAVPFTDPDNDCGRYTCNGGGACFNSCVVTCDPFCKRGNHCDGSQHCVAGRIAGSSCTMGCECASGTCLGIICAP